jgi:hypothetical protein
MDGLISREAKGTKRDKERREAHGSWVARKKMLTG